MAFKLVQQMVFVSESTNTESSYFGKCKGYESLSVNHCNVVMSVLKPGPYLAGGGGEEGGAGGQLLPPEMRQSDYNAIIVVIPALPPQK